MENVNKLFLMLGIDNCTKRHITIVEKFIETGNTDLKELLSQLGGWDYNDLKIAEKWFAGRN